MPSSKEHICTWKAARLPLVCLTLSYTMSIGCVLASRAFAQAAAAPGASQPADDSAGEPAAPETAASQPGSYRVLPVDQELRKTGAIQTTRILLAGKFANEQEQTAFDRFYKQYALAEWSLPENRSKLPELRRRLCNNLRTCGTGGRPSQVHDHLNAITLRYANGMATGNFHPATRVNAMLMIGQLNAKEAPTISVPPDPLPAALPVLVAALADEDQIDAVKVASMVGIFRHAELGAINSPSAQTAVLKAVVALLNAPRPAGRSAAGDAWMRRQAAEILATLRIGNSSAVVAALAKTVADKRLPLSTRCAAAEALGKLDYRGAGGVNFTPIAAALRQLTIEVCAAETEPISRRRLKSRLCSIGVGAVGIAAAGGAPDGLARLKKSLTAMIGSIENRKLAADVEAMMERINEEAEKLQSGAAKNP